MAVRTWTGSASGDWADADNWLEGVVPTSGDDVHFFAGSAAVTAGLDQSAVELASLTIASTWTGWIGAADADLRIGAASVRIGDLSGSSVPGAGSGRIRLDLGSSAHTTVVVSTAQNSLDAGREPVRIRGSGAGSLHVLGGRVGRASCRERV